MGGGREHKQQRGACIHSTDHVRQALLGREHLSRRRESEREAIVHVGSGAGATSTIVDIDSSLGTDSVQGLADYINDNILQFKYSLAHGAKGVTLLYFAGHTDACNLANAEAASGGGGAFVHPGFVGIPEMRAWGDWFTDHAAMYDGKEAVHDVGVLFFAEHTKNDALHCGLKALAANQS